MLTIALIARKGGSGKTTLAVHLALAAFLRGYRTLIADIDPQRSAIEVLRAREALGPDRTQTTGQRLASLQMQAVRDGVEIMIIDTAAGAGEDVANAIVLSDLSLIVVRPTFLDLAAAAETVVMVSRLRKRALMVVNQAPPLRGGVEPPAVRRALKALAVLRIPVAPTLIRSRLVYQTALEAGRSAEELDRSVAANDIAELWTYVHHAVFPRLAAGAA